MTRYTQRLGVSQTQTLGQTLSPQMQRTMRILQIPRDELEREVAEICETNPLIADQPAWVLKGGGTGDPGDWAASTAAPTNLADHLFNQLALTKAPSPVKQTAIRIIEHIAPDGRISGEDWDQLAGDPVATTALDLVQSFDPAGVGGRSLAECLALQLDPPRASCPAWRAFLDTIDALASEPARVLARRCGVTEAELGGMIAHLRTLDPVPGHRFGTAEPISITPDVRVVKTQTGEWSVGLTWDPHAGLAAEPAYRDWQKDTSLPASALPFLKSKQEEVDWLRSALKQRGQTLLRVARLAIACQDRFLTDGPEHLAPLTMREIAAKTDLHESTISRAVANKFILTPRGVLPLRGFFSTAVTGDNEHADISSACVRARIETLIREEASPGAMSDAAISHTLTASGVRIARRSVAKHREQIGVGSARERARLATYSVAAE